MKMPTKSQLETMVKDYESEIKSLKADRSNFRTELGKLAFEYNYPFLLTFLNFSMEEIIDLKELMK